MAARDVEKGLDRPNALTGVTNVSVRHQSGLLSVNGPCYLSVELKD